MRKILCALNFNFLTLKEVHPNFFRRGATDLQQKPELTTKGEKNIFKMKHFKKNLRKYILPTWKVNSDDSVTGLG